MKGFTALTPGDRELVQQLLDDVVILESQFATGLPKPSASRAILVPVLRRWIVDGLFYKAQRLALRHEVRFAIRSHAEAIKLCKRGVYAHWMGVLEFGTIGVGLGRINQNYLNPDGTSKIAMDRTVNVLPAPQQAKTFFEQRMFFWKQEFYTRSDVIKLHANSLGGIHFDPESRRHKKQHIHEIPNYFGFEVKGNNSHMLIGDEISRGRADPDRRPHIYDATELIAMDTARIFATGIRRSEQALLGILT
jgi:hypothetical protein